MVSKVHHRSSLCSRESLRRKRLGNVRQWHISGTEGDREMMWVLRTADRLATAGPKRKGYPAMDTLCVAPYLPNSLNGPLDVCRLFDPISPAQGFNARALARQQYKHAVALVERNAEPPEYRADPAIGDRSLVF